MKKLIAVAVLGLAAASSWAQGTIDFRNLGVTFKTSHDKLVYLGDVGGTNPKLVGTNYAAGLFFLVGADQAIGVPAAGIQAGGLALFRALTTTSPGAWLNPLSVGNTRILDGVPIGGIATLQVRVWDITKYQTFAQAFARGEYGWSAPFNYTVPAAGSAPDAYYLNDLHAFAVVVPEPSTIALGVLGVAGFLFLRRRKQA